jgi:hypothetical protein
VDWLFTQRYDELALQADNVTPAAPPQAICLSHIIIDIIA